MVGPGRAVDTRRFRAIGIDFLGGPGTAGPRCPITTSDQARVLVSALDYLDATEATLVGASYGGMVALAAGAAFPERVSRIVAICTAHRPHPMATALRTLQRAIIERGAPNDTSAVVLARALAMTTYRSAIEFEARFDSSATWSAATPTFQVTDYLMARGAAFSKRFDRHDYLRLSESIDTHCVEPETVRVPTVLVSVDSDAVVPPFLADELARRLPALEQHIRLTSRFGHDAFLKETAAIARVISDALAADATSTPHQPSSRATTHAP